jgi:hypothetical protein
MRPASRELTMSYPQFRIVMSLVGVLTVIALVVIR